ncbi:MAG: T9SS type A sorting domain-containing protein [Ignavibacteriae bacterium]|nr:T9SS type A sorting domain-containing protein [Ignavibacteriota bacterium]
MKKYTVLILFVLSISIYSQSNWDVVWSLAEKPFLGSGAASEISIVKAGFDTDQDGWGEFMCGWTDLERNFVLMYEATADNTYDLVWYWEFPVSVNTFPGIAVGDLDNSGKVDIVITLPTVAADDSPPRLWFFEWNGVTGENKYGKGDLGSVTAHKSWNFNLDNGLDFRPFGLTIEDIDKDGKNELICGVRMGDRGREIFVVSATGALTGFGSFKIEFNHQEFFDGSLYSVTTGDLDNDGKREIYAAVWANMTLRIFECNGDSQYELVTSLDSMSTTDYGAVDALRVADANKDGINELYWAGSESENTMFIVTGINDVSQITPEDIKPFFHIPVTADGGLKSMYIADPDNDSNIDLMIGGERNGQVFDLEYNGTGDPADSSSWTLNILFDIWEESGLSPTDSVVLTPRMFYGMPAGDMDKDGKSEYVFTNYSADFSVWANDKYLWMIESDVAVSVENPKNIISSNYNLEQNYPNPFNPNTKISYSIPNVASSFSSSQIVQIKVYDILGKEISTLVNEQKPAGNYEVNFNAVNLPSGIYFYKIQVGEFSEIKKMTLLK